MARPSKRGLDAFPLDVDIFLDERIVAVSEAYGIKAEIIVVRLLCAIYRQGYFIEWDERQELLLLSQIKGISKDLLADVVARLVRFGFFDRAVYAQHSVLTSADIQRRYFSVVRRNRSPLAADLPYLLVQPAPSRPKADPAPAPAKAAPAFAPPSWDTRPIEEKVAEIKADGYWLDQMQVAFHLPSDAISQALDAFIPHCHAYAHDHARDTVSELKRHFCNWLRRQPQNPQPQTPPSASDYSYSGGFGSID